MPRQAIKLEAAPFCSNCGAPAQAGDAFCSHCGAKFAVAAVSTLPSSDEAAGSNPRVSRASLIRRLPAGFQRRVRRPRLAIAICVSLLVVAAAAVWTIGYVRDAPIRNALDKAEALIQPINRDVADVDTPEELVEAADGYSAIGPELARLEAEVADRRGEFASAAETLIAAQAELAQAGASLATSTPTTTPEWGDSRSQLLEAAAGYDDAVGELRDQDGDLADAAALPDGFGANLESVLNDAVLSSAGATLEEMFSRLGAARETRDLRKVASDASGAEAATRVVVDGFAETSVEFDRLRSLSDLYSALSSMSGIDAEHLDGWGDVRAEIVDASAELRPEDGAWSLGVRDTLADVDRLVRNAQNELREWRVSYRRAVQRQTADTKRLAAYASGMNNQLNRYGSLRASLSTWIDRVEDPSEFVTYAEGYDVLWRAQTDREAVRDAMNALTVPPRLSDEHAVLVGMLDDAIAAVSAAYQGALDADYCTYTCYYKDSPGWQRFTSESGRITDVFATASEEWRHAVTQTRQEIRDRRPPEQPEV